MQEYKNTIMKVSLITLWGNILLASIKVIIGLIVHSNAIVSDGIHSATDVFSTLVVMIGTRFIDSKEDSEHPYGHERFECVVNLIMAMMFLITGLLVLGQGINKLLFQSDVKLIYSSLAILITLLSIILKEGMYWYTIYYAKKINCSMLKADAWHHRSDAFSSIGCLIGVIGYSLGYHLLDVLASLIICGIIFKVAYDIVYEAINQMIDHAASKELENRIIKIINDIDDIEQIDELKTRLFANKVYVDVEVSVNSEMNLVGVHDIAHNIDNTLTSTIPYIKHCNVHINPKGI